jgi:hypothetical protein
MVVNVVTKTAVNNLTVMMMMMNSFARFSSLYIQLLCGSASGTARQRKRKEKVRGRRNADTISTQTKQTKEIV